MVGPNGPTSMKSMTASFCILFCISSSALQCVDGDWAQSVYALATAGLHTQSHPHAYNLPGARFALPLPPNLI